DLFFAGLKSVDPYTGVKNYIGEVLSEYKTGKYETLLTIGFGKAVYQMALAVEESLGDLLTNGLVITKYGHGGTLKNIKIEEAAHPIPDENGLKATNRMIELLKKNATEKTLVLCLISGGGSALLVAPYKEITLEEKKDVTKLLLKAGADIEELNTVRKHISRVKGGRLAEHCYPARIISFILSDVIGDHLETIASGPTAPDETTYKHALTVLKKFNLFKKVSPSVLDLLRKGEKGIIPETLKKDNPVFKKVTNIIVGNNKKALQAIKHQAVKLGFNAQIISAELSGEAREVAKSLANLALKTQKTSPNLPLFLISGGETTVTVKGPGIGGRNTELALAFALEIAGKKGITLLSAGSDGTDGPTDAAGAIVNGDTVHKAKNLGLDPERFLENNDSYNFFKKTGGLFITGPTGTNVIDIQIIVVDSP
ncbi:MAG TPA: glycerate kinase, partial [Candidatus Desulfofervidus auxilii]|nr:glycerate kinase [Candidatus Desulfofervidus auxilii]